MPKRPSSPAQIASRFTYFLKGDLKRKEQLFILIAKKLVRVRAAKLWQTLKHASIEDYARKRLGLQKTSLYNYLQIHDWLKEFHPAWLARKPKGFIPDLTDSSALMWIEKYVRDQSPPDALRKELEAMRRKALTGALTDREFRALRNRLRGSVAPLRAMLNRMRALRRGADRVPRFPAAARAALDEAIRAVEQSLGSTEEVAKLAARRATMLARQGGIRATAFA